MFGAHILFSSLIFSIGLLASSVVLAGGWLGITVKPPQGVQVAEIFKESPADQSAIKKGDVINRVNGIVIRSPEHFIKTVIDSPAGTEITLDILRQGHALEIKVTLEDNEAHQSMGQGLVSRWSLPTMGEKRDTSEGMASGFSESRAEKRASYPPSENGGYIPPQERLFRLAPPVPSAWLGIAPGIATDGVVVMGVAPGSPAQQADLRVGDVITAINRQPILSPEALVHVLSMVKPDDLAEISFNREGKAQMLQVQLQKSPTPPVDNAGER